MTIRTESAVAAATLTAASASQLTPPVWVQANVVAGQNLNQTAGVLTVDVAAAVSGAPSAVTAYVNIHGKLDDATAGARVAAVMELWRSSGTPELLVTMATGYVRDANDHEEPSYHCAFPDLTPGTDPAYEVRTRRDSTVSAALPCVAPSTVILKAEF